MGDTSNEPVDPGETTKNTAKLPSLLLIAIAVVAFVVCLASFAERAVGVGIGAAIVMLLTTGAALAWLAMEARGVRELERDWSRTHRNAG